MSRIVASFVVTVAVVVPTAWHVLDADIEHDGRKLRPLQQSFMVGDAKVTLDIDRSLVNTGDSVKATLVAYSDVPRPVVVNLAVLQSHNYEGSRVEMPGIPIDHEKITLAAAPGGGKPVDTKLVLGDSGQVAQVDVFKIYVTAHGHKVPAGSLYQADEARTQAVDADLAAVVSVMGWGGNNLDLSIKPEGAIVEGKPVTIDVRLANSSGSDLKHVPFVRLATKLSLDGGTETGEDVKIDAVQDDDDDGTHPYPPFAANEVTIQKFVVVPAKGQKQITLVATADAYDDQDNGSRPEIAGAMEVRSFAVTNTPEVAAK